MMMQDDNNADADDILKSLDPFVRSIIRMLIIVMVNGDDGNDYDLDNGDDVSKSMGPFVFFTRNQFLLNRITGHQGKCQEF